MVSPIKSISGQNHLNQLIGYETKADLTIFIVTALSFYFLIYPNFENWSKEQIKTVMKASTPYIGTTAIISSMSAYHGTSVGFTAITALGIIFFAASVNRRTDIQDLRGLYPEILVGTALLGFLSYLVTFPGLYSILQLSVLSIVSTTLVFGLLTLGSFRTDALVVLPIFSHFVDASSTVIALENSLSETRLLAYLFIDLLGPYGIFVMKALIIIPVTFFAVRELDEKHTLLSIYLISALGLILGIRNILMI